MRISKTKKILLVFAFFDNDDVLEFELLFALNKYAAS